MLTVCPQTYASFKPPDRHVGVDADKRSYGIRQIWYDLSEVGAAEAAWFDILTERKSKYLGKKEPLFGEEQPSK